MTIAAARTSANSRSRGMRALAISIVPQTTAM
jgi:hypothetical protein